MKNIYRLLLGVAGLSAVIYVAHEYYTPEPQAKTVVKEISPVAIDKVIETFDVGTLTADLDNLSFEIKTTKPVPLIGDITLESATYMAYGSASAGFPKGTIRGTSKGSRVDFYLDEPVFLSIEDKLHVVVHTSFWSDIHFEEQARAMAKRRLATAACNSNIRARANASAVKALTALAKLQSPHATVVVHTTTPHRCDLSRVHYLGPVEHPPA